MDEALAAEIQKTISAMSETEKAALRELFSDEGDLIPAPKLVKRIFKQDQPHICTVIITCRLCGTKTKQEFNSVSTVDSNVETPTCSSCSAVLSAMSKEELVALAIRAADGSYASVKDAKNAPVVCHSYSKEERNEDLETNSSELVD